MKVKELFDELGILIAEGRGEEEIEIFNYNMESPQPCWKLAELNIRGNNTLVLL